MLYARPLFPTHALDHRVCPHEGSPPKDAHDVEPFLYNGDEAGCGMSSSPKVTELLTKRRFLKSLVAKLIVKPLETCQPE